MLNGKFHYFLTVPKRALAFKVEFLEVAFAYKDREFDFLVIPGDQRDQHGSLPVQRVLGAGLLHQEH